MLLGQTMAPGKMILCGEYAVLEGHQALVAAVDRYAKCQHSTAGDGLYLSAQGIGPYAVSKTKQGYHIPQDTASFFKVALAVLNAAESHNISVPSGIYHLDTSELYHFSHTKRPLKLGLGSSAAAAVCLAAHLVSQQNADFLSTVEHLALQAHKISANGRGSGIDIYAACRGGLLEFCLEPNSGAQARALPFSDTHNRFLVVHTHKQQKTHHFVAAVETAKQQYPHLYQAIMTQLANANAAFAEAFLQAGPSSTVNQCVTRINLALRDLGNLAQIPIVSKPHAIIHEIAMQHHGSAKPSGAGGGDIAVCFVPTEHQPLFCQAIAEAGYTPFYLSLSPIGIHYVDPPPQPYIQ